MSEIRYSEGIQPVALRAAIHSTYLIYLFIYLFIYVLFKDRYLLVLRTEDVTVQK